MFALCRRTCPNPCDAALNILQIVPFLQNCRERHLLRVHFFLEACFLNQHLGVTTIDTTKQNLYLTGKTGRIYEVRLGKAKTARQKANVLADDASIVASGVAVRRIVTRTSTTRLDGIAVDSKYLYWCETNTNIVARALRRDFQRQVIVGGSANSMLSWPRGIVLGSDDDEVNKLKQSYFYSEYTGRISRGAAQAVIVNAVSAPAMQYLDNLVQQSFV